MDFFAHIVANISSLYLVVLIVVLIFFLTRGADITVDGAVSMSRTLNFSPLVIGATVVSIGTTLPEAFVSVMAAWSGNSGLSLGNGVGSIIVDTGFILGASCLFFRVPIDRFILNRTGWVQVFSATLLVLISLFLKFFFHHPRLDRWVGILFLVLLLLYLYLTYNWSKQGVFLDVAENDRVSTGGSFIRICLGLFLVISSSKLLIVAVQEFARRLGVSEDVIAATMVAFGTSLPEFMTAISAARKGHPELMLGNVVGADVLNCFFVIGASALATPLDIPESFYSLHFPFMLLILYSFRLFISLNRNKKYFPNWQGGILVIIYLFYIFVQYR